MKGALDSAQATGRTAVAFEGLNHVPLGRRVEKGEFIAFVQGGQANQLHQRGIEKYAGCAAVVDVLEKFGL